MAVTETDGGASTTKPKPFDPSKLGKPAFGEPFNKPVFTPVPAANARRSGPTDLEKEKEAEAGAVVTGGGVGLQGRFNANDLNEYVNPPPDFRLNSIIRKLRSPLQQGIIQQVDDYVHPPQKFPYACRFMFNPTTVQVSYATSEEAFPPETMTPAQLSGALAVPGTTSLGFGLLFDRTYDVAYGNAFPALRTLGVYRDIAALESVVGARFNFAKDASGVIQPMQNVPCYFIFGGGGGRTVGLSFVGAIQTLAVTYSTFSENMVPMRASVEVTVRQTLGGDLAKLRAVGGTVLQRQAARDRDAQSARAGRGN